jgi:hypothetical protein
MLHRYVAGLREEIAPVDPTDRLGYGANDQCKCDLWLPPVMISLGNGTAKCLMSICPRNAVGGSIKSAHENGCSSSRFESNTTVGIR